MRNIVRRIACILFPIISIIFFFSCKPVLETIESKIVGFGNFLLGIGCILGTFIALYLIWLLFCGILYVISKIPKEVWFLIVGIVVIICFVQFVLIDKKPRPEKNRPSVNYYPGTESQERTSSPQIKYRYETVDKVCSACNGDGCSVCSGRGVVTERQRIEYSD